MLMANGTEHFFCSFKICCNKATKTKCIYFFVYKDFFNLNKMFEKLFSIVKVFFWNIKKLKTV